MIVADTSFLIDLIDGDAEAIKRAGELKDEPVYISSVSIHEYLFGVYYKFYKNESLLRKKLEMAENAFNAFKVLPLSKGMAKLSAMIQVSLIKSGKEISVNDVYIGATARYYNAKLLTRNKKHFEHMEDLRIERY
ncbi:MAG: type II toxin-antitoxin system VapC family toxin [Candidatus Micrarchaeota archaeon]|nr:type II toxin-antitoxin system VapC family toxin [Candidatus Micrarchaeota archaeon]